MYIVGGRKFVEIPGEQNHELPPLLVHANPDVNRLDRVMNLAQKLVDAEELLPDLPDELLILSADDLKILQSRRKMDLAVNLVEQYLGLVRHWRWGDAILEWIRQCEITFEATLNLRPLLKPDLWPHAGRSSFVNLLLDKRVTAPEITLQEAVGLRLTFRQPPPIGYFSHQFLFCLNPSIASSAYQAWTHMSPDPVASLPPERFNVQVITM